MGIKINATLRSYAKACANKACDQARSQGFSSTPRSQFYSTAIRWVEELAGGIIEHSSDSAKYLVEAAVVDKIGVPPGLTPEIFEGFSPDIPVVDRALPLKQRPFGITRDVAMESARLQGKSIYRLGDVLEAKLLARFCQVAVLTLICGYTLDQLFLNGRLLNGICHLVAGANERRNIA